MVDPNNPLLPLAENSKCLYIQYRVLLDDVCCMPGVDTTSFNNGKIELFEGVGEMFGCFIRLAAFAYLIFCKNCQNHPP